jgi:HEAT repeat protein
MNQILHRLTGGSLISDGLANEVADEILKNPELLSDLIEGLKTSDNLVRARTAHAMERISRSQPKLIMSLLPDLIKLALHDPIPMVRWHMPMIFANIVFTEPELSSVFPILFRQLKDESVFVKTWAIASLAILGKRKEDTQNEIKRNLRALTTDPSISVRTRAKKAIGVLEGAQRMPKGWYKGS